jgi:ABC-type transport system involved in multi-copper enzyme maturation permease subunit
MIDLQLYRDAVAAEWTKVRSVRSTYWTIIAAVVLAVGLSAAISAGVGSTFSDMSLHDQLTFDATEISLAGLHFAQLALGVFAILTISAEYSTGTIRTAFSAVPQRGYVLAAKALVVGGIAAVVGIGSAFAAFSIGQLVLGHYGLSVSISHAGVARAVLGGGLYIIALVLFALGLATIIRHTAGAITTLVAIVFIIPPVTFLLPDALQRNFSRYLPANAGGQITTTVAGDNLLGPWAGYAVFLGWTALALAAGWYLLRTRDV